MSGLEQFHNTSFVRGDWLWMIAAAPLLGALLNGALVLVSSRKGRPLPEKIHSAVGCGAAVLSFLAAFYSWMAFRSLPVDSHLTQDLFDWIDVGSFQVHMSFDLDALSITMVLFVTFLSSLIHVYSIGYMKGDRGFGRYFAYLNLFLFSMLMLVMAQNLLVLFLGWEGVGFCSYLLIGFWFEDEAKAEAGKKAIIVNRIGDAGFMAALLIVFAAAGTFNFNDLLAHKSAFTGMTATAACLCFFFGAAGKSAQIPLYIWLPDAMAGPTPVSALIHAATMVTAGVYLIARLHFLYVLAPWASTVVAVVGVLTALFAATIALAQDDIKKVLAYSTISQLGFMFLGVGVGAYDSGIFHLVTHGFFKACLFLGAGSVIHAMKGEQNIRKMGGLLKHIPLTGLAFLMGWLAISGMIPFSGFFSKDEILWRALATPNSVLSFLPEVLYFTALFTAFLTAFYMTRLVALVFFGEYRGDREVFKHLHESPLVMTVPLLVLAAGSLAAGWIGLPESIGGTDLLGQFLKPVFEGSALKADMVSSRIEPLLMLASFMVSCLGMGLAWYIYGLKHKARAQVPGLIPAGKGILANKYYVDEIYQATVVRGVKAAANLVSDRLIEGLLTGRLVDALTGSFYRTAQVLRKAQVGLVRVYLAYVFLGAAMLIYLILR